MNADSMTTHDLEALKRLDLPFPDMDALGAAFHGKAGRQRQAITRVVMALATKLLQKNADYGGSAFQSPMLAPNVPAADAILTRLSDKLARFINLAGKEDEAQVDEALVETAGDACGYFVLWLTAHLDGGVAAGGA